MRLCMTSFFTKKDLEKQFGLADTTVYRTLKVCGLSTSRRSYSEEEIKTRFMTARQLYEAGLTSKQIAEYFNLKPTYDLQKRTPRKIRYQP